MNNLDYFFNPRSIAIVGATDDPLKFGHEISKNVRNTLAISSNYNKPELFLINHKRTELFNQHCYKRLSDIPISPDLTILLVPAKFVLPILSECTSVKTKTVIIVTAGFGEIDEEGKLKEQEMLKIAREGNFRIMGPNCVGIINMQIPLNASFILTPPIGSVSTIAQSGSFGASIIYRMESLGQGIQKFANLGNAIDVQPHEMISYFQKDQSTKVISLYLETIKTGRAFFEKTRETTHVKPVVILKSGRTSQGQISASSHTGALASDFRIFQGVAHQARFHLVENEIEFQSAMNVLSTPQIKFQGEKVGIITNAGGPGVILTDLFDDKGIKLAKLGQKSSDFDKYQNPLVKWTNPLDIIASAREKQYQEATKSFLEEKDIDILVILCVIPTFLDMNPIEHATGVITSWLNTPPPRKPLIMGWLAGTIADPARKIVLENKIPYFTSIPEVVSAVNALIYWNKVNKKEEKENN
jgi:acyl-CoA synthetase (NDP forming)